VFHARPFVRFVAVVAVIVAACGGGAVSSATSGPPATASPIVTPSPSAPPSFDTAHPDVVRLALDWTPNTDHTGFYVARAKGWYQAAAVDLKILPYGSTPPETILAAGQADCGISFQDSMTFAVASGAPIRSVMAILQRTASAIAVRADSKIQRPRDLDGKVYASFDYPNEVPTVKAIIQADGGKGDFRVVHADATAYEALYSRKADFTIPFTAWEGIEAKERGIDLRYFQFRDYGFPDFYQVVLACSNAFLQAHPDLARRFVTATAHGFAFAASDPDAAAAILISENPGIFDANKQLPLESARFLASGRYYVDANGAVGRQTLAQWTGYSDFLFKQGLLTGPDGNALAAPLDYGSLFTNEFLP
jgi:ABC-type nitrate/sulfonate/bicarbonate transport system substrate-binding protein